MKSVDQSLPKGKDGAGAREWMFWSLVRHLFTTCYKRSEESPMILSYSVGVHTTGFGPRVQEGPHVGSSRHVRMLDWGCHFNAGSSNLAKLFLQDETFSQVMGLRGDPSDDQIGVVSKGEVRRLLLERQSFFSFD
ncbi:hypothetical protein BHE74_00056736 [Ensete ventricosum]|nr:hypothetical protein BHE74_00056736 [Ensete ventricosum]